MGRIQPTFIGVTIHLLSTMDIPVISIPIIPIIHFQVLLLSVSGRGVVVFFFFAECWDFHWAAVPNISANVNEKHLSHRQRLEVENESDGIDEMGYP